MRRTNFRRARWMPSIALQETEIYWMQWAERYTHRGPWRDAVMRSLITLKGLTYAPTGGIVAALTTSLPEKIGGVRNWDYRYCWLRDATFTLFALLGAGYEEEAKSLARMAPARDRGQSRPVTDHVRGARRAAARRIRTALAGRLRKIPARSAMATRLPANFSSTFLAKSSTRCFTRTAAGWRRTRPTGACRWHCSNFLESKWHEPDEGIWEVRGPRRQFTHSKVMAWVAFDRAVKLVENYNCEGEHDLDRWKNLRDEIHREVCQKGFHPKKKAFTQTYGSEALDASLLMIPLVGFLPALDERVCGTIEAVERDLLQDGLVLRYRPNECEIDGLPGSEGVFLPCSFWLADCLHLIDRKKDARLLFERLLDLRNDVGLLSEEYDPKNRRQLGNFPQAFSHVGLVNTAQVLSEEPGAAIDERKQA